MIKIGGQSIGGKLRLCTSCNLERLVRCGGENLVEKWREVPGDEARGSIIEQWGQGVGKKEAMMHNFLRGLGLNRTTVNGILGSNAMHLLSTSQWQELPNPDADPPRNGASYSI